MRLLSADNVRLWRHVR